MKEKKMAHRENIIIMQLTENETEDGEKRQAWPAENNGGLVKDWREIMSSHRVPQIAHNIGRER